MQCLGDASLKIQVVNEVLECARTLLTEQCQNTVFMPPAISMHHMNMRHPIRHTLSLTA